jgi:hypothetical protein
MGLPWLCVVWMDCKSNNTHTKRKKCDFDGNMAWSTTHTLPTPVSQDVTGKNGDLVPSTVTPASEIAWRVIVSCHRVVSCRVVSCCVVSCRVVPCRAVRCCVVLCGVMCCRDVWCCDMPCGVVWFRAVSWCGVVMCCVVSWCVVSCGVVWRPVVLCGVVWHCVVSWCVVWCRDVYGDVRCWLHGVMMCCVVLWLTCHVVSCGVVWCLAVSCGEEVWIGTMHVHVVDTNS